MRGFEGELYGEGKHREETYTAGEVILWCEWNSQPALDPRGKYGLHPFIPRVCKPKNYRLKTLTKLKLENKDAVIFYCPMRIYKISVIRNILKDENNRYFPIIIQLVRSRELIMEPKYRPIYFRWVLSDFNWIWNEIQSEFRKKEKLYDIQQKHN